MIFFFLFFFFLSFCVGGMDGCVAMVEKFKRRSPTGYGILFVRFVRGFSDEMCGVRYSHSIVPVCNVGKGIYERRYGMLCGARILWKKAFLT